MNLLMIRTSTDKQKDVGCQPAKHTVIGGNLYDRAKMKSLGKILKATNP